MTTPALAGLKKNFPQARISVLCTGWVAPIFTEHPAVAEVIIFDRENRHRGLSGLWRLTRELKKRRFDMAVLFQNAFEAALLAWLARTPLRLGYNTDARGPLLNRAVRLRPEDKKIHETEYYQQLLARSGLETINTAPVFYLSQESRFKASTRLEALDLTGEFLLGLAPGATYGPAKQWPAERFAETANMILEGTGGTALIFGSQAEADVTARVKKHLKAQALDLAGRTELGEAGALIERCCLFLTNDSGLMHVAAAVGTPLVAVFGSTNPATTSPIGDRVRVIRHQVDCSPCLKQTCDQPTHKCMELITPAEAAEAGMKLLQS